MRARAARTRLSLAAALTLLARAALSSDVPLPKRSVQPTPSCESFRDGKRFNVLFDKVELEKLVQVVADTTCRTFVLPESVKGKISIVGPEDGHASVDANGFYAAFLSALDANGLTVLHCGALYRIIEKTKAAKSPIPTFTDAEEVHYLDDEMVTRFFRIRNAELEPVRSVLAQLLSPGAELVAYPPDSLIVTEMGTNLVRLEKLLAQLDVAPSGDQLRLLTVRFASAPDLAEKIQRVLDKSKSAAARPGAAATTPVVVADERTNKLVVLGAPAAIERVEKLLEGLDVPQAGDGQMTVYLLKNAEAKDVATTLEPLLQGAHTKSAAATGAPSAPLFTGDVKVAPSEATNSLVVMANPTDYRNVARLIERLDAPRKQIFIEAAVLEIDIEHDSDLGVNFHDVGSVHGAPVVFGTDNGAEPSSLSVTSLLGATGTLAGIYGPLLTNVASKLGISGSLPEFGIVIHALQKSQDVNLISTPHLLAMDNKEAVIHVGQKVPFQTGYSPAALQQPTASGVTQAVTSISQLYAPITRENVELKFTVKPHIGDGEEIRLEIDAQTEDVASIDKVLGPTTSTRGAKTTIVVRDRRTVVLGGIMQDQVLEEVSKVPFLGDIPLLGNLFRSTSTIKKKTNLLLLLTPTIVRSQEDFEVIAEEKDEERQKLLEEFWGEKGQEPAVDFRRQVGPLASMAVAIRQERNRPENGGPGNPGEKVVMPVVRDASPEH